MPFRCVVVGCANGYDSTIRRTQLEKDQRFPSLFRPSPEQFEDWKKRIPIPAERFKENSRVCEEHFDPKFIVSEHVIVLPDGSTYREQRGKKKLCSDAVPTIFPNCPSYLTTEAPLKRRTVKNRKYEPSAKRRNTQPQSAAPLPENEGTSALALTELTTEAHDSEQGWSNLHRNPGTITLPNTMWATVNNDESTIFVKLTPDLVVERSVVFSKLHEELYPLITLNGIEINLNKSLSFYQDIPSLLEEVESLQACPGTGLENSRSMKCSGFVKLKSANLSRCSKCTIKGHTIKKMERSRIEKYANRHTRMKKLYENNRALVQKIKKMEGKLNSMMVKYDELSKSDIENIVETLPPRQQEAVHACIAAARAKKPCGRRYTQQWVYECALLRVQNCGLYQKMIRDQTLALPSLRTIQLYMKKLKPAYGFIPAIFELLSQKTAEMDEAEKHGLLLIDEMSLTSYLSFNKTSLKVDGFVNLGEYTPEQLKDQPGDHALVFMFKPFKAQWFQTVAAFLSKGAVDGPTLSKLCLEATALIEQTGLFVDMWVCDGAPWNRAMWNAMGVSNPYTIAAGRKNRKKAESKRQTIDTDKEADGLELNEREVPKVGFPHPCNMSRTLYLCSDFPHIIKCMKNRILPNEKGEARDLLTPDGVVKFAHWVALFIADSVREKPIQVCPKLTKDHLYPHNYQTMNVGMAFSFFSNAVADAMEYYREEVKVCELSDCEPTVKFIRRVNALIDAMNANTPWSSIRKAQSTEEQESTANIARGENNAEAIEGVNTKKSSREVIIEFLYFLDMWCRMPSQKGRAGRLPHQTEYSLFITLNSALQLSDYLIETLGFEYVMTRRMNQDSLEHFFGAVRQACGCNSHPDPLQFIQVYRLLSAASLVKPVQGSNITGAEMIDALLNSTDIVSGTDKQMQKKLEQDLDNILDNGEEVDFPDNTFDIPEKSNQIDKKALRMFCGYVARKARRATVAKTCEECFSKLQAAKNSPSNDLDSIIEKRSEGFLLKPSEELFRMVFKLENVILNTLKHIQLHENILCEVVENAREHCYEEVGCQNHRRELTKAIMRFYLSTRMIFACKQFNKRKNEDADKRKKMKDIVKKLKVMPS